jgi:beta-glucosidase
LDWLSKRYGAIELVVTENGVPVPGESDRPVEKAVQDTFRLEFYRDYLNGLCQAVAEDGVNVTGYYAWSFMDNLEWLEGFRPRFGIVYVDFAGDLARTPKHSALWLSQHFFKAGL